MLVEVGPAMSNPSSCVTVLEEAGKRLEKMGIRFFLDRSIPRLVVLVDDATTGARISFAADCVGDRVEVVGVVSGVYEKLSGLEPGRRVELLERLLRINFDSKISVGVSKDGLVSFQPWGLSVAKPDPDMVVFSLGLVLSFSNWLLDQVERAKRGEPLRDYTPRR